MRGSRRGVLTRLLVAGALIAAPLQSAAQATVLRAAQATAHNSLCEATAAAGADPGANPAPAGGISEEPCPRCIATLERAVKEGRVDEALAWLYRLLLRVMPDVVPERFRCLEHRMELVVSVAEIHENKDRFVSREVRVRGVYMGWSGQVGDEAGLPATRSDWLLKDETGWIYVTGGAMPGLSPWRKTDQGKSIEVIGVVRIKDDGIACLEFKEGRVLGERGPSGDRAPVV